MKDHAIFQGEINIIAKIIDKPLKIFFPRNTGLISTELYTKHLYVKGIQVSSNEGPHLFPKGDNNEASKIDWHFKIFSRTTGSISTKLVTKHSWWNGHEFFQIRTVCFCLSLASLFWRLIKWPFSINNNL